MIFKKMSKVIATSVLLSMIFGLSCSDSYAIRDFHRIYGDDRFETSYKASEFLYSKIAVLSNGYDFSDTLSASNLCNSFNAKLMLVNGVDDISNKLVSSGVEKVYIVDTGFRFDSNLEDSIKSKGIEVVRVSGDNKYETNRKTLEIAGYDRVGLASGEIFADALSSSQFLKENKIGLMLYDKQNPYYGMEGYKVDYIFGGEKSVDINLGERISGLDRYETSTKIANLTHCTDMALVSGTDFSDALSSINMVNSQGVDVVLVPDIFNQNIYDLSQGAEKIFVVGGPNSVKDHQIRAAIFGEKGQMNSSSTQYSLGNFDIIKENNKNYLRNKVNGEIVTYSQTQDGRFKANGNMYILSTDDSIRLGWIEMHGKKYYSELPNGLRRGWRCLGKDTFYFSPTDYYMYSNGIKNTGEGAYWFGTDGKLKTGYKPSGHNGKKIMWYGPTKQELENKWLNVENSKSRFRGQNIVNFALQFDGLPFKWYGSDLRNKSGVYCCGAAYSAYKEFGIRMPGPNDMNPKLEGGYIMVRKQYQDAPKYGFKYIPTNFNTMMPGDINYSTAKQGQYNHAALYIGKNGGRPMTIHATLADGFIAEPMSIITSVWHYSYLNTLRYDN